MSIKYEVVRAVSSGDALEKSQWKVGDLARCVRIVVSSNSKGTYSVFPEFERIDIVGDEQEKK